MSAVRTVLARLRGLVHRNIVADEIREELASHLESRVQQYEREGLSRTEAERRARLRIGNLAVHQDHGYDVRGGGVLDAIARDLRWAWRGVRGRGWRAVFVVFLLGVTIAANAVVFAAADAFVFRTVPYADPSALVVIQRISSTVGANDYMSKAALVAWRAHRDLFAGVEGHERGTAVYLTASGVTEAAYAQLVTPGMFSLLGVMPRFGRPFTEADAERGAAPVVIISDGLARRLYGSAAGAVGQSLWTGHYTSTGELRPAVVGVMPASFRFPTAAEEIWQPLNLERWRDDTGIRHVARLASGRSVEGAIPIVRDRLPLIPETSRKRRTEPTELRSLADFRQNLNVRTVFAVLIAAAICLLLIACANVASLELAAAARRVRDHAIQTALGASRASLIRVGLFEAALLMASSLAMALGLTIWGSALLADQLTTPMRAALANPLDLDARVMTFTVIITTATWLLIAIPTILRITRSAAAIGLREDPRVMAASRASVRVRQVLMTGQVALTVLLLVGALLYIRTYEAKVSREIGFDASRVATISVSYTPEVLGRHADLNEALLDRLRHEPGVLSVARTMTLPPSTQAGVRGQLRINGDADSVGQPMLSTYNVDPEYFRTLGITAVQGQLLDASSPPNAFVIDEALARRYWPNGDAVGSNFAMPGMGISLVVGVSRQLRADRSATPTGDEVFVIYKTIPPDAPVVSTFVAKLDDERRLESLRALVRAATERAVVRIDTVEARYAKLDGDTRLAAAITSGFGAMALLVATCGIYAMMAFLVAGRSREIGIRMALGADRADVRRMIFSSSLRFVAAGGVIGLGAAALASRLIASQLFGVTPTDPLTYGTVATLVMTTAMAATWWPARRASRIDPAITLRSE